MAIVTPLPESEATEKILQTYERIKEMLGVERVPEPFLAYARVPAFLQDFFMNSKRFVFTDGKLPVKTKALLALIVSAERHCTAWVVFWADRCRSLGWSEQEMADGMAVAATCAMYNAFYKFRDLAAREAFLGLPVGLRAHTFGGTSLDDQTIEFINIAISDMNSCHACVSGHVAKALELGASDEAIQEAVQCAATMIAGITFLSAGR